MRGKWRNSCTCTSRPIGRTISPTLLALAGAAMVGTTTAAMAQSLGTTQPIAGPVKETVPASTSDPSLTMLGGDSERVFGDYPLALTTVIFDNGGPDGDNGLSNFQGTLIIGGIPTNFDRVIADDFELTSATTIEAVTTSGVWFGSSSAPGPLAAIRVRVYADAGGQPGAVLHDSTDADFDAVPTGGSFFGRPEVLYQACVDITLNPGFYWISIQPTGTTDNFFQLTSATGAANLFGEEAHIQGDFDPPVPPPNWQSTSGAFGSAHDMTFQLVAKCEELQPPPPPPGCGDPDAGDCCVAQPPGAGNPYCDDADCCALICAQDPFCCNTNWDSLCASAANAQCDVCTVPPPPGCGEPDAGDCCEAQPPGAGSPFCDDADCCELICALDPFCCNTNWDSLCASAANAQCDVCIPDPACGVPGTGDCCEDNGSPFCDDADCCESICADDPFCCNTNWDSLCAAAANEECDVCQPEPGCGDPGTGDCCEAMPPGSGSPFCEDADCCELVCAADSFCCNVNWDSLCANRANNDCEICQPDPEGCSLGFWKNHTEVWVDYAPDDNFGDVFGTEVPPESNCCTPRPPGCGCPGCDDADCEAAVCACDSFCCNVNWDSLCAGSSQGGTCGAAVLCSELCEATFEPVDTFGDCTLHDVISSPSGGPNACSDTPQANSLGKQAVAALLNASAGLAYGMTAEEVIDAFNDAHAAWLADGDTDHLTAQKDQFDFLNNQGCPETSTADINVDGHVNFIDLMFVLDNWGAVQGESRKADLNGDGVVNIADLMIVIENWGPTPVEFIRHSRW